MLDGDRDFKMKVSNQMEGNHGKINTNDKILNKLIQI